MLAAQKKWGERAGRSLCRYAENDSQKERENYVLFMLFHPVHQFFRTWLHITIMEVYLYYIFYETVCSKCVINPFFLYIYPCSDTFPFLINLIKLYPSLKVNENVQVSNSFSKT
jgi:hypothetical protein